MEKHPYNIFPEMQADDYTRLVSDLKSNGYDQRHPICLYNGQILDGWNRFRACTELGIVPSFKDFNGTTTDAINYVMRTNKRRNLTSSQWAAIAVEADEIVNQLKEEAEKEHREKSGQRENYGNRFTKVQVCQLIDTPVENTEPVPYISTSTDRDQNRVTTRLAEVFKTNRQYVHDAAKLRETKPEIFQQIKSGEKTITEVKKELKKQERKDEIRKQVEQIESGELPEIKGLFHVIAIDPPWPYGREYDPEGSRVANPYPEMSIEQIKAIDLPLMPDSVVFLWTTHAFLKDAFDIMNRWGLDYKATIVWDKERMGMGANIRMQCEFCLLAFKGNPVFNGTAERDIIREARREHSRKPEAFYQLVERTTEGRRLEYFSRAQRENWSTYGNEVQRF